MSFASINKDLAPAFADRFSSQSSLQSFQTLFAPLTDSLKTLTPPIPEHESIMTALVMQSKAPAPLDLTKSSNHPSLANQLPKAFETQTHSDTYQQQMAQEQSAVKEQFSAQLSPDALKETDPKKMSPLTRLVKHFPTSLLASAQSAHYPHGYESRMNTLFTSGSEHLPEKRFAGSPSYQQTKKLLCQSSNPNPIESKKESESMNNIFSYREKNSPKTFPSSSTSSPQEPTKKSPTKPPNVSLHPKVSKTLGCKDTLGSVYRENTSLGERLYVTRSQLKICAATILF
jgi:hypothetical protein